MRTGSVAIRRNKHAGARLAAGVLLVAFGGSLAGAYLLNPIFGTSSIPGYQRDDLGFKVYFNGVSSDNEPVLSTILDERGIALEIELNPLAGTMNEAQFGTAGEIVVGRAINDAGSIETEPLDCTASSYVWDDSTGSLVEGPNGEQREVDAAPYFAQGWAELGYPNPGTDVTEPPRDVRRLH